MNVKKIFAILITVVVMIILGALVINVVVPNGFAGVCNAIEGGIKQATGIEIDFNGDGSGKNATVTVEKGTDEYGTVEGFN